MVWVDEALLEASKVVGLEVNTEN